MQDTPRFVAGYIPSFAHKNPKFCWPPVNVRTNVENPPFAVDNFRTRRNHGFFHIFPYVYTVSPQLFTAFCSRMYLKMGIIPILNAGRSFFWDNAAAYQWLLWPTIIYYPSDFSTDFSRCSYIFPDFSRVFQLFSRFFQVFQLLSTKNPRPVDMPKHSAFLPATPGPLPPGPPGNLPPRHRPASQRGDLSDREREVMGNKMWDENKQN